MNPKFKRTLRILTLLLLAASLLAGSPVRAKGKQPAGPTVVVANRGSGTLSVINAASGQLIDTLALPANPNPPEPMYVVYSPQGNRVFVGDRANSQVVVFTAGTFAVEATIPTADGVFHMWADPQDRQLWVAADGAKTYTVIDTVTLQVIASVPIPADLAEIGGFPHDIILDPLRPLAFASILGVAGAHDYIIQYDTNTFLETGRAAVGKDPHVSLARQNDRLYVPAQNSNVVHVLDRVTLAPIMDIPVPGAHGAGMRADGQVFYTTNLPGGGRAGLVAIDTHTNTVIGPATDTPYPVPHNIVLSPNGRKLFVTHSGATADKVTIYFTAPNNPTPILFGEVTVGLNPFGLAYVP
jgi:DNA-binding beta-propeller fold protein YncE